MGSNRDFSEKLKELEKQVEEKNIDINKVGIFYAYKLNKLRQELLSKLDSIDNRDERIRFIAASSKIDAFVPEEKNLQTAYKHFTSPVRDVEKIGKTTDITLKYFLKYFYLSYDAVCRFQGGSRYQEERREMIDKLVSELLIYSREYPNHRDLQNLLDKSLLLKKREDDIPKNMTYEAEKNPSEDVAVRAARDGQLWALKELHQRELDAKKSNENTRDNFVKYLHIFGIAVAQFISEHRSRVYLSALMVAMHKDSDLGTTKSMLDEIQKETKVLEAVLEAYYKGTEKRFYRLERNNFYVFLATESYKQKASGPIKQDEGNPIATIVKKWLEYEESLEQSALSKIKTMRPANSITVLSNDLKKEIKGSIDTAASKIFKQPNVFKSLEQYESDIQQNVYTSTKALAAFPALNKDEKESPLFALYATRYALLPESKISQSDPKVYGKAIKTKDRIDAYHASAQSRIDQISKFYNTISSPKNEWESLLKNLENDINAAILVKLEQSKLDYPLKNEIRKTLKELLILESGNKEIGNEKFLYITAKANDYIGRQLRLAAIKIEEKIVTSAPSAPLARELAATAVVPAATTSEPLAPVSSAPPEEEQIEGQVSLSEKELAELSALPKAPKNKQENKQVTRPTFIKKPEKKTIIIEGVGSPPPYTAPKNK